jgi:hypothetical protein
MSSLILWHRSQRERIPPGLDAETAAERYWTDADARYEQSRDNQLFTDLNHTENHGNDKKISAAPPASLLG